MGYVSTRGAAPELGFADVLLAGLARDGGLYVPEAWPALPAGAGRAQPYAAAAAEVMAPFVAGALDRAVFDAMVADAYRGFDHPEVAPLTPLGGGLHLLELFHGPTLAFKDVALQLVGRLFDHELARRGERVTVVGATSGDTGSAAIEALRDREALDVFILHPAGRVSEVQRRQMTTVASPNVFNLAVAGTFDDCQDLVKACFADEAFRDKLNLSAVNSINWARVMAQIVYYVTAAARFDGAPVAFAVPTGNFGNVYAGHAARCMGLPVARLVVASNRNDILTRWFETGSLRRGEVSPTLSPSMDIQVSSNLERLLFELAGRDGAAVAALMDRFRSTGEASAPPPADGVWAAARVDEAETLAEIRRTYEETGVVLDPHSAVGVAAARRRRGDPDTAMVCLATAHPAKFPDAVERAIGRRPALPERLADLLARPERLTALPNDLAAVQAFILAHARAPG
ncbi:MAG: threonine synthase [Acidimicrobiales bacterium]